MHCRRSRIAEDRAPAERARSKFHPPLEPPDRTAIGQIARSALDHAGFRNRFETGAGGGEPAFDVAMSKARTKVGAAHAVGDVAFDARLAGLQVIGAQRRTQRAAGVASGWLNPHALELAVAQDLAVGHAVQCHAAGETKVLCAGFRCQRARKAQHHFLGDALHRGCDVHVELCELFFGRAHRLAEQAANLSLVIVRPVQ